MLRPCLLKRLLSSLTHPAILGLLAATFTMSAAWDHNPQGEFHNEETGINWPGLLLVGLSWFALVFTITCILKLLANLFTPH